MKIVYMGTPDFAVAPLAALVENGYEVEAVITQPDKPKGRGKTMMPTPVKEEALKHEIPVLQLPLDRSFPKAFWSFRNTDVLTSMHPCFRNTAVQLLFSRQLLMGKRSQVLRS